MLRRRSRRERWKKGGPSRPGRPAAPGRLRSTAAASCRGVLRSRHRRRRQTSSPRAPCRTSGNSQDNPAGPPGASGTCRCIFVDAFQVGLRSRAMPHFAQTPGLSDSMPGHIGQKYFCVARRPRIRAAVATFTARVRLWHRLSLRFRPSAACVLVSFVRVVRSVHRFDAGLRYFHARSRAPTTMKPAPIPSRTSSLSPSAMTAIAMAITTLSLSMGATFETSPNCSARK